MISYNTRLWHWAFTIGLLNQKCKWSRCCSYVMNIICVTVLSGSATVTADMVLAMSSTFSDDSLLACPVVRRFRLLQLLILYSEELVVATLVDVLLTDAHQWLHSLTRVRYGVTSQGCTNKVLRCIKRCIKLWDISIVTEYLGVIVI